MVFKIRTSKRTMTCFEEITASTNYAPFILSKLAISISIRSGKPLVQSDFHTDSYGLELNRQTITGEWDELYKCTEKGFAAFAFRFHLFFHCVLNFVWWNDVFQFNTVYFDTPAVCSFVQQGCNLCVDNVT